MKIRQWVAVVAVSTACVVSLAALRSPSVQLASPVDPGTYISAGKGKGPKCNHHEVFCNPTLCEQPDCSGNSCNCVCVPIPGCVPPQ